MCVVIDFSHFFFLFALCFKSWVEVHPGINIPAHHAETGNVSVNVLSVSTARTNWDILGGFKQSLPIKT